MKDKTIVIIPARYASTRFPGKPLAKLKGREMILRVCDRVNQTGLPLAVATDDQRIYETVVQAGFMAVMTSADHKSGTDRVAEAVGKLDEPYDIVINVQGDEPFIDPTQIIALRDLFNSPECGIGTLVRPYPANGSFEGLEDPNVVKVETNGNGEALMFSRHPLPFLRGVDKRLWPASFPYKTHVGIYAYRSKILKQLTSLSQTPLEKAESLEQLRWLENGYKIFTSETDCPTIGIDTPEDLAAAEKYLETLTNMEEA